MFGWADDLSLSRIMITIEQGREYPWRQEQ